MNQHYAFWVDYYSDLETGEGKLTKESTEQKNEAIVNRKWVPSGDAIPFQRDSQVFCLKTAYPGLTTGIGLPHSVGKDQAGEKDSSDVQLGFSFDYVTGLPVIPGSSVKGVLRSAFLREQEYTLAMLKDLTQQSITEKQLKLLELLIFGDPHPCDKPLTNLFNEKELEEKRFGNDVFFDAFPVQAGKDGKLMGMDYITPHLSSDPAYQGLTEPNPNAFLKVLPGVTFQFRFWLTDSDADGFRITAEQKAKLFKNLLMDFGAGAKTNVGYGILTDTNSMRIAHYLVEPFDGDDEPVMQVGIQEGAIVSAEIKEYKFPKKGKNTAIPNKVIVELPNGDRCTLNPEVFGLTKENVDTILEKYKKGTSIRVTVAGILSNPDGKPIYSVTPCEI